MNNIPNQNRNSMLSNTKDRKQKYSIMKNFTPNKLNIQPEEENNNKIPSPNLSNQGKKPRFSTY